MQKQLDLLYYKIIKNIFSIIAMKHGGFYVGNGFC